jgi:hypothetical protein
VVFEAGDTGATYVLRIHECSPPRAVLADGHPVSSMSREVLEGSAAGWTADRDVVTVKARARVIHAES